MSKVMFDHSLSLLNCKTKLKVTILLFLKNVIRVLFSLDNCGDLADMTTWLLSRYCTVTSIVQCLQKSSSCCHDANIYFPKSYEPKL